MTDVRHAHTCATIQIREYRVMFDDGSILDVRAGTTPGSELREFALAEAARLWGKRSTWKIEGVGLLCNLGPLNLSIITDLHLDAGGNIFVEPEGKHSRASVFPT